MAITDYIPNVFGSATPTTYEGLLGMGLITPQQLEQTQKTANIQGLLGAGLALAQGMSRIGPRRSAAENILGALAGGFGAAGGAYQQGLQNIVQQQQLQSAALTQQQTANRLRAVQAAKAQYPDLAPLADIDPGKFAEEVALRQRMKGFATEGPATPDSLRSQAQGAYLMGNKPLGDSYIAQADRLEIESRMRPPTAAPVAPAMQEGVTEPTVEAAPGTLPGTVFIDKRGPDAQLLSRKNQLLASNQSIAGIATKEARDTIKANLDEIKSIDEQLDRIARSTYDFTELEKSVPEKFKPQVKMLKQQVETGAVSADTISARVNDIFNQVRESERGMRIDGLPGNYAQMKYGTSDQSKLSPNQLADVIAFANAPTADQYAQLTRESQRLQFETGRGSPVPAGRSQFLGNVPVARPSATQPPVVTQPVVTQPTTQPVVSQPAPTAATQPATQPVVQPAAQQQTRVSQVIDPKVYQNPLITRPDSEVPPKKKQELIQAQPGLVAATNYTIKNIVDARNAAQALLDNPNYMDAISGMTAPVAAKIPGTDAYTANEILNNILGRSFISEIQEMRANSPTGGAVGNVAVAEMNSLSKIRGALTIGMNKSELKKQLESYIANANRAMKTIPNDYARTYGYSGEFDDLLSSEVVSPKPTSEKLPPGVKVRRK